MVFRRYLLFLLVTVGLAGALMPRYAHAASTSTLRIWYGTDDPTESPLAHRLADQFQAAHRGVEIQLTTFSLDDINTKLQLALSAGTPPDLIYTTPRGPGLPAYVRAGKLLDITAAARQGHWANELPGGLLSAYNDGIMPTGRANGHVYGVPSVLAAVAVLYNKQIFARLHLSVPTSVAALTTDAAKVKAAGLVPFGLGNADGWLGDDWYLTLVNAQTGPGPLRPELQLEPHFNFGQPAFHNAAATLLAWDNRGYFTPQFGGLDAQDSITAFFDGKTAMQLVSSTENGQIAALAQQTRIPIGVFAFPSDNARQAPVMPQSGYEGWAIPRAGHQPALAEQFISFMLSDGVARQLAAHGLLPVRPLSTKERAALSSFDQEYFAALQQATPGVYLDGAPVPNLNATMEANIQLLLQHFEPPTFLSRALQQVYTSHGTIATSTRTDGEF
jgi:raffinose/stachyose/melibiose transport system substrate-binding protein